MTRSISSRYGRALSEAASLELSKRRWPNRHAVAKRQERALALGSKANALDRECAQQRRRVHDAIFLVALQAGTSIDHAAVGFLDDALPGGGGWVRARIRHGGRVDHD